MPSAPKVAASAVEFHQLPLADLDTEEADGSSFSLAYDRIIDHSISEFPTLRSLRKEPSPKGGAAKFDLHQHYSALHMRSMRLSNIVFRGFWCHPMPCMLLKLRLCADSTRTRFRQSQLSWQTTHNLFED
jgi:hypothetical protein